MTELTPRAVPRTIDETLDLLTGADYVADRSLATVLFLSLRMKRPCSWKGKPVSARPRSQRFWRNRSAAG